MTGHFYDGGICPFCGGKLGVGCTEAGRPDGTILHTQPPCETFDQLGVLDFALAVKAARVGVPADGSGATS